MLAILTNFQDNIFKIIATCFIKTSRWFIIINIAIIIIITIVPLIISIFTEKVDHNNLNSDFLKIYMKSNI